MGRLVFCELLNAVYSACFYSLRGSARLNIACEGPMPIPKACLLQGKRGWTGRHDLSGVKEVCAVSGAFSLLCSMKSTLQCLGELERSGAAVVLPACLY